MNYKSSDLVLYKSDKSSDLVLYDKSSDVVLNDKSSDLVLYDKSSGARFTKDLRCILHPKLGRKMIFAKKLRFTKGS